MPTVYFFRYGAELNDEFDTLDECLLFLAAGNDRGDLASSRIVDGERVIVGEELDRLVMDAWDKFV